MPFGLTSSAKTELAQTTFAVPIYCVRITRMSAPAYPIDAGTTEILRYAERQITFNDGSGSATYTPRLHNIGGYDYDAGVGRTAELTATLANIDGAITALDRTQRFAGARFELIAYLPGKDECYIPWTGYCDDITEMTQEQATITAYSVMTLTNMQAPKRTITLQCNWEFGNTANYLTTTNFEGSECPYQRTSTVGFVAHTPAGVDVPAHATVVRVQWPGLTHPLFLPGDVIRIDSEYMVVLQANDVSGLPLCQDLTVKRGYNGTSDTAHNGGGLLVAWGNCQFSVDACKRRGMYGTNSADTYGGRPRNYFGGFPFVTGYQYGRFVSQAGTKAIPLRVSFSGNDSAYGQAIPLVYGKVRINTPILLVAKPEGDFLTTLWAVAEGVLATNAADDTQATTENAYTGGSNGMFVNGVPRHDARFPSDVYNGQMDQPEPGTAFFPADSAQPIHDFTDYHLGFWATARAAIRINIQNNPSVDVKGQSISGTFYVAWGRVHRIYTSPTAYVRRATADGITVGTNAAWVLLDLITSKRAGGGMDHSRFDIQSFIDHAAYCDEILSGTTSRRWTFNGVIDTRKTVQEWIHQICLSSYCLPPFQNAVGKYRIKSLKAVSLTGLPVFSSSAASSSRNILWEGNRSSLTKSRAPQNEVPNEIRGTFIDASDFAKVVLVISDRLAQRDLGIKLGDQSNRVVSKSVDLPGVTTQFEAARILTLILRAGEYGRGGLANNLTVKFRCFYRDAPDLELGDVIEVYDDLLDTSSEHYFRVITLSDSPVQMNDGGYAFTREVVAVLHANEIYDDGALTVTGFEGIAPPVPFDAEAPAVTGFSAVAVNSLDANGQPQVRIVFTYTEPVPRGSYSNVVIFHSNDDGSSNPDELWEEVADIQNSGASIPYPATGEREWFAAVSRNMAGVVADVNTYLADSTFKYPRTSVIASGSGGAGTMEYLTNGNPVSPEIIYAGGDVLMVMRP